MSAEEERIFDASLFRDQTKAQLLALLDSVPGQKLLIFEPYLLTPINMTIETKTLTEHKVAGIKFLEQEFVEGDIQQIIFFVTPQVKNMERIKSIIYETQRRNNKKKDFTLVFWPQRTTLCKEALDAAQLLQVLDIRDFNFDLIPLDNDLLSLEMDSSFRDLYLDNDLSIYSQVAESIMRMQLVQGRVQNLYLKGDGAKLVYDIMENMRQEESRAQDENTGTGDIETLIILDRSIDYLTPLMTQMTQQGRVDEVFGLKGNIASFGPKIVNDTDEPYKLKMSSEKDFVFRQVRDLNIMQVGDVYDEQSANLKQVQTEKSELGSKISVDDTQRLLSRVKDLSRDKQSAANHLNIKGHIIGQMKSIQFLKELSVEQGAIVGQDQKATLTYVEQIIPLGRPLYQVLRLMCIQSLLDRGIKEQSQGYFLREIVHCYGFDTLCTFNNLQRVGLLRRQDGAKSDWKFLKEDLRILNENVNMKHPDDLSYSYTGYAPLTARLVEHALVKGSWKNIKEIDRIPGYKHYESRGAPNEPGKKRAVMVQMVGGVTYGEITAFRFIAKQIDREIIIATTHIINSKKMIECLYDHNIK